MKKKSKNKKKNWKNLTTKKSAQSSKSESDSYLASLSSKKPTSTTSEKVESSQNVQNAEESTLKYDIMRPWLTLDDWQKDYINTDPNQDCFLLTGRQSGKTTAMSIKAVELCIKHFKKGEFVLINSITEKQAYHMLAKAKAYAEEMYSDDIDESKDNKPTKHRLMFNNGSGILCYAAGESGEGLRGLTIKKLMPDEGSRMSEEYFIATMPMLSVIGGSMDIASTPAGKCHKDGEEKFFYKCSKDKTFKKFFVSGEDCPRHTKEFLAKAKDRMSDLYYAQEFLAVFTDDLKRLFDDNWIKSVFTLPKPEGLPSFSFGTNSGRDYFLGMDIARMGKDETTFECLDGTDQDNVFQIFKEVTRKNLITETARKVIRLNEKWNFNKIGLDDGGLGVGVLDILLGNSSTADKVIGLNNAKRDIDAEEGHKPLLKEDMYVNLLVGGESGKIHLINDDELIASFKSIQWENYGDRMRISGGDSHEAEGVIRAYWLIKQKLLKPFIMSL